MSLAKSLADAVAFQVKFFNREDSELKARREELWATVEKQIERVIDTRVAQKTLHAKRK